MPEKGEVERAEPAAAVGLEAAAHAPRGIDEPVGAITMFERHYPIKELSEQFVVVRPCDAECKPDDLLSVRLTVPIGDSVLDVACQGYVIRVNKAQQEVALMISGLSPVARAAIARQLGNQSRS